MGMFWKVLRSGFISLSATHSAGHGTLQKTQQVGTACDADLLYLLL